LRTKSATIEVVAVTRIFVWESGAAEQESPAPATEQTKK
jgi:hypothetical protein